MIRILICFFIITSFFEARAELSLFDYYLSSESVSILEELSATNDVNVLLNQLKEMSPELNIIVVDLEIVNEELSSTLITWRDNTISPSEYQYYEEYTRGYIQSVGYYVAPGAELQNRNDRPLKSSPLMVLKSRMPLHGVLHEVIHFLIDQSQRNSELWQSLSEDVVSALGGVAEESFVDAYILSQPDIFNLEEKDICFRHKYLNQNLQVLRFLVDELRDSLLVSGDLVDELYSLYGQAYSISYSYRMDCLLLPYRN